MFITAVIKLFVFLFEFAGHLFYMVGVLMAVLAVCLCQVGVASIGHTRLYARYLPLPALCDGSCAQFCVSSWVCD